MSDAPDRQAENPAPDAFELTSTAPKKRRGRPPGTKAGTRVAGRADRKPETPQQRRERLRAELQKVEEEITAADDAMALIVGKRAIAKARANPDYRRQLAAELDAEVTSKAERAAIAELLS